MAIFNQSQKYPKTKNLRTLLSDFGDMSEMSQRKKTVFCRGCESDTVERGKHIMPQAGRQSDRLAASVEKDVPAKPNSLSTL